MSEPQQVNLVEVVGSPYCVSSTDGEKLHELVSARLHANAPVVLSFAGVEDLTTAFLNTAIGQLYGEIDEEVIRRNLSVTGADNGQLDLLKRVIDRAKAFFAEPARFEAATAEAFGD
jgi:hypothetical protein